MSRSALNYIQIALRYTKEVERTGGRAIEIGELRFIIYSEQAVLIYTIIREKTPVS